MGKWSKCHACKNRSGVRKREVDCVEESPKAGADDVLVEDEKCKETKPGSMELCEAHEKCKTRSAVEEDVLGIPSGMLEDVWRQINRKTSRRDVVSNGLFC